MKAKMTITIKKRSQPEWLSWFVVVMPFLFGLLNTFLGLPWAIRYLIDAAWVILTVTILRYQPSHQPKNVKGIAFWVGLFFFYTLFVYLVQYQSFLYYLWGFRNNFRFYAVFFAFVYFLKPVDIDACYSIFDKLFWVNAVVTIFQFLFLSMRQDFLGGIFGAERGVNGYTNIFFSIVIVKSIVFYLEKRETTKLCIFKCLVAFLITALAELKFFFVEAIVIITLAVLFTNFSWKKFWIIAGGALMIFAFSALLVLVFPSFANFFSIEWFLDTATSDGGYTGTGDINRLNVFSTCNRMWLRTWGERIFGLGLGNCDTSTFAIVNTPFNELYEYMHYTWISYAFMYLECGCIGLIFYFGFFVLVYFAIKRLEKDSAGILKTYCRISRIMAILCAIISIYNSSLRTEAGYMAYFVLAVPFAVSKQIKTFTKECK